KSGLRVPIAKRTTSYVLLLVLIAPILLACSEDAATQSSTPPGTSTTPATPATQATPADTSAPFLAASPEATPATSEPSGYEPREVPPEQLLEYIPSELGGMPIFMYHNIVTGPSLEGHLYRTVDELYADLQWLYDNIFYLVGMNAVVRGHFEVPAGKHPVVLTFDDSSSMHFSFEFGPDGQPLLDEDGGYVISPTSAVGVIERVAA